MMEIKKKLVVANSQGVREDALPATAQLAKGDTVMIQGIEHTITQVNHEVSEDETVMTTSYVARVPSTAEKLAEHR